MNFHTKFGVGVVFSQHKVFLVQSLSFIYLDSDHDNIQIKIRIKFWIEIKAK